MENKDVIKNNDDKNPLMLSTDYAALLLLWQLWVC